MDFRVASGYCDLNLVSSGDTTKNKALVRRALDLGYTTLALNVSVDQKDLSTGKKAKSKKAGLQDDFPEPPETPKLDPSDYPALNARGKSPVILKRLTVSFSSNDFLPLFNNSSTARKYDLVALVPDSALALQNLLKSGFRADIVAFDAAAATASSGSSAPVVKWNRKLYNECVQKHHMVMEVTYGPAIADTAARRKIIRQTHVYHSVGKSRSVVVTSGATSGVELRSPHDVVNLGHGLFNLDEQQAKNSVTKLACDAVKSGAGRRLGPFRAVAQAKAQLGSDEAWKIPSDPKASLAAGDDDGSSSSGGSDSESGSDESGQDAPMKVFD